MLDQNTDRMWYVIGAVIVGAAIIFLVNSSFPQLFASVGTTFENKVEEVSEEINNLSPTYGPNELTPELLKTVKKGKYWGTGTLSENEDTRHLAGSILSAGNHSLLENISVTAGTKYRFTAPNGLDHPRMVFFDKDGLFISGVLTKGYNLQSFGSTVPENAVRMGISAGDADNVLASEEYGKEWASHTSSRSTWRLEKVN